MLMCGQTVEASMIVPRELTGQRVKVAFLKQVDDHNNAKMPDDEHQEQMHPAGIPWLPLFRAVWI